MLTFEGWAARAVPLEVDGIELATHVDGPADAPVVTFLHGYPSSSLDGVPLLDRLGDEVRFVTLDLPGFGASAKPPDHGYTIHGAVDATEALWRHLHVERTLVVAHDYSVSLGQELLARQAVDPDRTLVTGVVWCNGGLWPDLHRQTLGQQLLLDPEHGAAIADAMDEAAIGNALRETWGTRSPMTEEVVHGIWRSLEHGGGSKLAHRLLHYVADRLEHRERWAGALDTAAVPMRFVWGDLDPVSGGHVADRIEERLPTWPGDRALHRLADVGHWPTLEAPDEVTAAVRDLLGATT